MITTNNIQLDNVIKIKIMIEYYIYLKNDRFLSVDNRVYSLCCAMHRVVGSVSSS